MAISAKYHIQYSASATPVEEILGINTDSGTDGSRIVHSDIDKSVGGGIEIYCGAAATGAGYFDYLTTTSYATVNALTGKTLTNIDFVIIKIRESMETDLSANCTIKFGAVIVSKLTKVGDVVLFRPNSSGGGDMSITGASGKICKLDILWGSEA
jgi:hypothetical protein